MMILAYLLGAFAFMGGIGLTVSSGWLITMASSHPPILTLGVAVVLVRFFGIFRSVARYFERIFSHKAVFDQLTSLRVRIYSNLAKKSISTSSILNSGNAVKTLVDDVERAQEYQLRVKLPGYSAILAITSGVLLGWWIRAESLLITVPVSILLLLIIPQLIMRKTLASAKKIESTENQYIKSVESSLHGVVEAQIYGYFEQLYAPAQKLEDEIKRQEHSLIKLSRFFSGVTNLLIGGSIAGSALLAFVLSKGADLPAVQVAMMIFLPLVLFESVTAWLPNLFASGKLIASQDAVDGLLLQETEEEKKSPFNEEITYIEFKNAQVSWSDSFMQKISCQLHRGETLVIRGISGSGKSTLAMGLLGLLPYKGSITFNGREISTISNMSELIVGTVQKNHIFNTSVRENLKIANPSATDDEILSVLEDLGLDALISEMSAGLDTIIGEFGRPISGGEAKRFAIARALLAPAQIFIFDEPTEHLNDVLSERVMAGISKYCAGKFCMVITHTSWRNPGKTLTLSR